MSKISLSFFLSSLLMFFHFSLSLLFLRFFESCLLRGWKTELVSPFRSLPFRLRIRLTRNNLSLSLLHLSQRTPSPRTRELPLPSRFHGDTVSRGNFNALIRALDEARTISRGSDSKTVVNREKFSELTRLSFPRATLPPLSPRDKKV